MHGIRQFTVRLLMTHLCKVGMKIMIERENAVNKEALAISAIELRKLICWLGVALLTGSPVTVQCFYL